MRVPLETAARLCGRSAKTVRAWLAEDPPPLSVEYGHFRGGTRGKSGKVTKGRTRLLDVADLEALNRARGGTWHPEHMPPPDVEDLAREIEALKARLSALEGRQPVARAWEVSEYLPALPSRPVEPVSASPRRPALPRSTGGRLAPLPEGYLTLKQLDLDYGCPEGDVKRGVEHGEFQRAEGWPWDVGNPNGRGADYAFSPEEAAKIIAKYGRRSAKWRARHAYAAARTSTSE